MKVSHSRTLESVLLFAKEHKDIPASRECCTRKNGKLWSGWSHFQNSVSVKICFYTEVGIVEDLRRRASNSTNVILPLCNTCGQMARGGESSASSEGKSKSFKFPDQMRRCIEMYSYVRGFSTTKLLANLGSPCSISSCHIGRPGLPHKRETSSQLFTLIQFISFVDRAFMKMKTSVRYEAILYQPAKLRRGM